ncbi:hypothetical protein [Prochlorococcus marinus]|uniref:hypothetical protein n=1 Tax=Prochlorococcus marinus TaxID=1219 RepID=UPI0007B3442D|nr:hypothetical protein [Prochlorococcus marinus]KZR75023.1 hypothetical protein PMIT1320_01653 [Prochlorococcus marinus str. MIT 1320]
MQHSLRLYISISGSAALALASAPIQPFAAQEDDGNAAGLGVMEIKLNIIRVQIDQSHYSQYQRSSNQASPRDIVIALEKTVS